MLHKTRFVISLTGGLIEVFTNAVNAEVILVDWDCDSFDEERATPVRFEDHGERYKVYVEPYPFENLPVGPLSFVARALELKGYGQGSERASDILASAGHGLAALDCHSDGCDGHEVYQSDADARAELFRLGMIRPAV